MRRVHAAAGVVIAALGLGAWTGGCSPVEDETPGYKTGRASHHDPINGEQAGDPATLQSGTIGGESSGNTPGGPAETSSPNPPPSSQLAERLSITEIAIFQGVKVSLAKGGAKTATRNAPIVAGRDGLVRVYVTPETGYAPREITAELNLSVNGKGFPIARDTKTISAASTEGSLPSTFNFDVPGASLPEGVEYFVQLIDRTAPMVPTASANTAQYPNVGGTEAIGTLAGGETLKIVLVPVRYGADGSNRLPDTGAAMVDTLKKRMLELYPVASVDITVHAAIDHAEAIAANGTGWDTVLADVTQLRMTEKPASDVYYYGVFAPAATITGYCSGSCVVGLSNFAANVGDAAMRASVGVLYNQKDSIDTLPHELGHAHGRRHAPCGGPAGPDPTYPYTDATIGVWGYSIVTKDLKNPAATTLPHDFMSYCNPGWTSDYTFKALFDRTKAVQNASIRSLSASMVKRPLRILFDRPTGPRWHDKGAFWSDQPLDGEPRAVTFFAGDLKLSTGTAHRYAYDHLDGGYLILPDAPLGTTRVEVEGIGVVATP